MESKNKAKIKPKAKVKAKVKAKSKVKKQGIIVEVDKTETKKNNPQKYLDKLKNLIYKIKNQTLETDNGIRFGWKN